MGIDLLPQSILINMNIFYLDVNPELAAQYHNDKHVIKMILESAQMLSTAHRVLDGELYIDSSSGRKIQRWRLSDPTMESKLYKATHVNHPCSVWARESKLHYEWLYTLFLGLCNEYYYRYGKIHKTCEQLVTVLNHTPHNIKLEFFQSPPQAIGEEYQSINSVDAYRDYYRGGKSHLAKWTKRDKPIWY